MAIQVHVNAFLFDSEPTSLHQSVLEVERRQRKEERTLMRVNDGPLNELARICQGLTFHGLMNIFQSGSTARISRFLELPSLLPHPQVTG